MRGSFRKALGLVAASTLAVGTLGGALALVSGLIAPQMAGATNTHSVSFTTGVCGTWQSTTVPTGLKQMTISLVGGGGGGGNSGGNATGGRGGGGAQVAATTTNLTAGQVLWAYTGCGGGGGQNSGSDAQGGPGQGTSGSSATNLRTGNGANGGSGGTFSFQGGGGGGASALCVGTAASNCSGGTVIAVAGGGGAGGGAFAGTFDTSTGGLGGGSGPGDNGTAGTVNASCQNTCTGGGGGTQSTPGTGGSNDVDSAGNGATGSGSAGGIGGSLSGNSQDVGGGGGGGGFFGGGGGTWDFQVVSIGSSSSGTGGGGGSSYYNSSFGGASFGSISGTSSNCGSSGSTCSSVATGQAGSAGHTGAAGFLTVTWTVGASPSTSSFSTEPGNGAVGGALTTQPQVTAKDYTGQAITDDPIGLSIATQPSGATAVLSCTTNPVTPNGSGVAAFSGCSITGPVGTYTLHATDQTIGLVVATSSGFTVGTTPKLPTVSGHTWTTGQFDSSSVSATGFPTPTITHPNGQPGDGKIPNGLKLQVESGTATFSGTPAANAGGTYSIKLIATNEFGSDTQFFTIRVLQAPIMAYPPNGSTVGVQAGVAFSQPWSVSAPATTWPHITQPVHFTETGLPAGTSFNINGDGTGTITGTLSAGTYGPITITATNVAGSSSVSFSIKSQ